ncbi:hypothetical protein [Streptomyces sp. MJP52]|uniref:hypothetical protein n=1 Tax=Streptomyces sp. MJP52 TaxID=2940555 RepID=UPI002473848C|nr:hypothetical protein [Streptomyces sp. MJP52]MDH6223771.1 hypothetical protein [Streptomyces sp. MJP52]
MSADHGPTAADLLAHEEDPDRYAGTEFDVRAVVPRLPADPADAPWDGFTGPYGPVGDVPGHLAGLASADPEVADEAPAGLWRSLHHQGTVYASAALAAPFLLRPAARPRTHDRQGILALVAACARGAAAQLAHRHGQDAGPWLDALLRDPARPAEAAVAASLARLCFEEARPAPEELRPVLDGRLDDTLLRALDELP